MNTELRPFWATFFKFNWQLGCCLIFAICIPRFLLVLRANETGQYAFIGLIMVVSAIVPFILLSKYGRNQIGITKPKNYQWLLWAVLLGLLASLLLHFLGQLLYQNTYEHWYMYISKSYKLPVDITPESKRIFFMIFAIPSMIFSPIGEELFFRGIVHESFVKSLGEKKASIIDNAAFALTHISHFGLVFFNNQWDFLVIPTIIWVTSMFLVSWLFFICKKLSGSIVGAILCHSAFNLGMVFSIFYLF